MDNLEILLKCIEKYSKIGTKKNSEELDKISGINYVSKYINVNKGTVKRWIELKNVPNYYRNDLCEILGIPIDFSTLSAKEKDQFFTSKETAKMCFDIFKETLRQYDIDESEYIYVEPSAGDGSFYNLFPIDRRVGIDIESNIETVILQDYLKWEPKTNKKYLVLGNPPFGLRSNLALRFLNHSNYADFVGFILPQLFDSKGKGSTKSRVEGLNLIHSSNINPHFYFPDGKEVNVNVIFQIWAKDFKIIKENKTCNEFIRVYSLSDGGTIATTRNKNMLDNCDIYLPLTCFGKENMKIFDDFITLPKKTGYGIVILKDKENITNLLKNTDWTNVSFKSTNGAYNLRTDLIQNVLINKGFIDEIKINE